MSRFRSKNQSDEESRRESDFHIAIGAAPRGGLSLDEDIRLLKPALLYGDRVTLYSPMATMLAMTAGLGELSERDRISFLRQLIPIVAAEDSDSLDGLDLYEQLRRRRNRTTQEIMAAERFRRELERHWDELQSVIERTLEQAGADQLVAAVDAGLLTIDPLLPGGDFDLEEFLRAFVDKLAELLTASLSYPLFDDSAGGLVQAHVAEGLIVPSEGARGREKQVTAASEFMSRLPAFPAASIHEVLGIRDELKGPLVRFRAGMVEIADIIEAAPFEEGFQDEVQDIYIEKVGPALADMEDAVRQNAYLQQLLGSAVADMKTILTGVITLGVTQTADLSPLIAAGAAAGAATIQAAWNKQMVARRIRQQQLYFLYRTEELL
jgi:hypothetical protein